MKKGFTFDRREFIKTFGASALGAVAWGGVPGVVSKVAQAQTAAPYYFINVLFDGGPDSMDYLHYDLQEAINRRPTIQRASASMLNLPHNGGADHPYVKLNGNFSTLVQNHGANFAAFSAVQFDRNTGSHEDDRDYISQAASASGKRLGTGWLGRVLDQINAQTPSPFLGWSFSTNDSSNLKGAGYAGIVSSTTNLANYSFTADNNNTNDSLYRDYILKNSLATGTSRSTVDDAIKAADQSIHTSIARVRTANQQFGTRAGYPANNGFGNTLRAVATLMNGGLGQVFVVRAPGGHDTHSGEVANNNTSQAAFTAAMNAFITDLKNTINPITNQPYFNHTFMRCRGEFGRQIKENSTNGTDHGWGGFEFWFGGRVKGGLRGAVATPDQIANDFALPRLIHPNALLQDVVQTMGLDVATVLPQPFTDTALDWLV
jgi:uncharacterized protein (DUF1501 family)